jgi:hypothetical protein
MVFMFLFSGGCAAGNESFRFSFGVNTQNEKNFIGSGASVYAGKEEGLGFLLALDACSTDGT